MMSMRLASPKETQPTNQFWLNVLGCLALAILIGVLAIYQFYPVHTQIIPAQQKYIVKSGDTLFGIEAKMYPAVPDVREVVYEIQTKDHITNAGALQAGTTIDLPVIRQ